MKRLIIESKLCKSCGICIEFCPKKVFEKGENKVPYPKYNDRCSGCGLCALRCPEFAINVEVEVNETR